MGLLKRCKEYLFRIIRYCAKRRWLSYPLISIASAFLLFLILNLLFPLTDDIRYSVSVESSEGKLMSAFLNKDDKWRLYVKPGDIPAVLEETVLTKEDRWFYYHPGINPAAIARALFNNTLRRKRTSGASTITMQVARLLFPAKRTVWNKISEMFRALQLEWKYSKKEILRLYLNLVPYGGNIEGIRSASILYFNKEPGSISTAEAVVLAIIPNRPGTLRIGSDNSLLKSERDKWIRRLLKEKSVKPEAAADAIREPVQIRRYRLGSLAPHLCRRLAAEYPGRAVIRSSISLAAQNTVETHLSEYVNGLHSIGIFNGSVIVIDNKTHKIIASAGSSDFHDDRHGGQVDGTRAVRSPGSTLKPFLYTLAFEKGLYTPKSTVLDVPSSFNGYEPENYDETFHGPVSVEYALVNSLNIPAVRMLDEIGVAHFRDLMANTGFNFIRKNGRRLGLSMVLGGCGVTLEELAMGYHTLATGGNYFPANYLADSKAVKPVRVFSPEAGYLTTEMMSRLTRPDMPNNFQNTFRLPKIAWKTGTSYGRRDAWAVGFNTRYTIAVWIGNFDNAGVPELSGAATATPMLFELFKALDRNTDGNWLTQPARVKNRSVCSVTGNLPAEFCTSITSDVYIEGITLNKICTHMKDQLVSEDSSLLFCRNCVPENYIHKLYPDYAPELVSWFQNENIAYDKTPPHNPACTAWNNQQGPGIYSPLSGSEYLVEKSSIPQLLLACHTSADVTWIYWYVNDKLVKKCKPGEQVYYRPELGRLKISCTDDKGRNTNIYINVREL